MTHYRKISCLALVGLCIAIAPNSYASENKIPAEVIKLANKKLGEDFRMIFTLEKNVKICGGDGEAYVGQVEMNKPTRSMDEDGKVQLKDNWVKIDKFYSIYVDELNNPNPSPYLQLFDNDNCLE